MKNYQGYKIGQRPATSARSGSSYYMDAQDREFAEAMAQFQEFRSVLTPADARTLKKMEELVKVREEQAAQMAAYEAEFRAKQARRNALPVSERAAFDAAESAAYRAANPTLF